VIAVHRGSLARLRLALLCAALSLPLGAPPAHALAELPRPAAVCLVTAAPARTEASRRHARRVMARGLPAPRRARSFAPRAPDLAERPAAPSPYVLFHALLR
jgi:hypothetical protein